MAKFKVRYFKWRNGRPRWEPGPALRRLGLSGIDLRDTAGYWLSLGDAIMRAEELNREADAKRLDTAPPARGIPKAAHSIEALWERYQQSGKFTELAEATQHDYRAKAKIFLDELGPYTVLAIDKPVMHWFAEKLMSTRGKSMAIGVIAVARRLFSYAELIGWRPANSNPAFRLELARPSPRLRLGTPSEIIALVAAADCFAVMDRRGKQRGLLHSMGDAIVLALHSGQRQRDVLAMPDTIVDAERIKLSQFKTGAVVDVKMTPACAKRMAAAKKRIRAGDVAQLRAQPIIIHEGTGAAYNAHTFRHLFADVRARGQDVSERRELAVFGSQRHGRHALSARPLFKMADRVDYRAQLREHRSDPKALPRAVSRVRGPRDRHAGRVDAEGRHRHMSQEQIIAGAAIVMLSVVVIALARWDHAISENYKRWQKSLPITKVDYDECVREKRASRVQYFDPNAMCHDFLAAPPPEEIPPSKFWEAIAGR